MAGLALLLAGRHKVEGALLQGLALGLGLCHRAVGVVLGGLLIPVAHIALVVDCIEGHEFEARPFIGGYVGTADIDGETKVYATQALDAVEDIGTVANKHRRIDQALRCGTATGRVVHTSLAAVDVLEGLDG